jgi:hypothetical protein
MDTEPDIQRSYRRDLLGLGVNGAPCEVCGNHMHDHAWADLNPEGFVVNCSVMPST